MRCLVTRCPAPSPLPCQIRIAVSVSAMQSVSEQEWPATSLPSAGMSRVCHRRELRHPVGPGPDPRRHTRAVPHLHPQTRAGGLPVRDGVVNETPFIGTGLRHDDGVEYIPTRLSLVPRLYATVRPPDCVLVQTSPPRGGKVSLGMR